MGMRADKTHINLAFVRREYHRRGGCHGNFLVSSGRYFERKSVLLGDYAEFVPAGKAVLSASRVCAASGGTGKKRYSFHADEI